jgi:hypothetical protein
MSKFKPDHGYSVVSFFVEPRNVDSFGADADFTELYSEGRLEIVIPEPTRQDRESHGLPKRGQWDDGDQAADEYRDSFFPMMDSLWPVVLAYGRSEQTAADLMNRHGGATSLISIDGDDFIAMTGGGMDLSWHLAAAYVCCGAVPPLRLLESLRGSPFMLSPTMNRAVAAAAREGAAFMRRKAKTLAADVRGLGAKVRGAK